MDSTFETIGLDLANETAFNTLAVQAGDCGEVTQLPRRGAVWHGRCWKLGEGLEVWTVLYENRTGETSYANCRPGFRARYLHYISPWALTEYDEEGEAVIHGYCRQSGTELLFELQNLTEVAPSAFNSDTLCISLCGLAYRAQSGPMGLNWQVGWEALDKAAPGQSCHENDWRLHGFVEAFRPLRNPLSGRDLYWVRVNLAHFRLEVLVNRSALRGTLHVGAAFSADIWLQGHVLDDNALRRRYEGVDYTSDPVSFWRHLRRHN